VVYLYRVIFKGYVATYSSVKCFINSFLKYKKAIVTLLTYCKMPCHNRKGVMCDTRTKLAEKVALNSRRKLLLNRQGRGQDDLLAYSCVDYYTLWMTGP
jgi:hypothetical protein